MTLQRPTESGYADAPESMGHPAYDEETTADLPFGNTVDLARTSGNEAPDLVHDVVIGAATTEVESPLTVDFDSNPVHHSRAADVPTGYDLRLPSGRRYRALGFFAFAACALIAVLTTIPGGSSNPTSTEIVPASTLSASGTLLARRSAKLDSNESQNTLEPLDPAVPQKIAPQPRADASIGVVTFKSRSFVTSEQAVSAVFILKRTHVLRGRALVHWAARSGSADAGIDFADASGTVRFADGQRQAAIYVRLRNDLLEEEDESFKVCVRSAQARISGRSCAEMKILDDDGIAPT